MTDNGSKNPTQKSIERWEGEGGATRSGPQTSSKRKRADDTNKLAKEAKRRLRADEKQRIAEERRLKEIAAHPNKMIAVHVQDETDESGAPIVTVQHIGESARDRRNRNS
jgi:hypothetical protein